MEWLTQHWVQLCAALWAFDQLLALIAPMTPWSWDDSIASWLGKILAQFFPKKQ